MRMACLVFAVPVLCLAQAPLQPRLVVDDAHHDFGKLAPDTNATHRFQIRNAGTGPLHITGVKPSCGCTSTVAGRDLLAPGEQTEIEVTFHSAGVVGHAQKTVTVSSDDPQQPSLLLTFEADVKGPVSATQELVLFQELATGDRRHASVRLSSETGQAITVTDADLSEAPWLGVATRPEGNDVWVDLDLVARKLPPSRLTGLDTIALHLLNPRPSILHLAVRWAKRAPVIAAPAQVAWAEPAGQDLQATVLLRQPEHQRFRILSVRTTSPLVQVAPPAKTAATRQPLHVTLSAKAKPGHYDEKVFVVLDTPGHPEFELRVSASLR